MNADRRLAAQTIMALERQNRRLVDELKAVRDESRRRMIRIKEILQQKVFESHKANKKKLEKINELEGQLEEAENIVIELREELKCVRAENKRLTRNDVQNRQSSTQPILCPPLESQKVPTVPSGKENISYPNQLNRICTIGKGKEKAAVNTELSLSVQPYDGSGKGKGKLGEQTDTISTRKGTSGNGVDRIQSRIVIKEAVGKDGNTSCWYELIQPTHDLAPDTKHRENVPVGILVPAVATAQGLPPPVQYTFQRKRKSRSGGVMSAINSGQTPADGKCTSEDAADQPGNTSEDENIALVLMSLSQGAVVRYGDQRAE